MHPLFQKAEKLSRIVIGAALDVHRVMGPGMTESIYERCLLHELSVRNVGAVTERPVPIRYKGVCFEEKLRFDLVVEACLLVEVKAVHEVLPIHKAQLLAQMEELHTPLGLLLNFREMTLTAGLHQMVLPHVNDSPEAVFSR